MTVKLLGLVLPLRQDDLPSLNDLHHCQEVADLALDFDPCGHSKLEHSSQPIQLDVVGKWQRRQEGRHQRRRVREMTEEVMP